MRRQKNLLASAFVMIIWTALFILLARDIYKGLEESDLYKLKPRLPNEIFHESP